MAVRTTTASFFSFTTTALSSSCSPFPPKSLPLLTSPATKTTTPFALSSPSSSPMSANDHKFMDFPFASAPIRDAMVDLVTTVEDRLSSHLLPSTLPPDVQYCRNDSATAHASLHIRPGHDSSPVDFIMGSWLHCELPTGGSLNITSLSAYLNTTTDAPNLLIELIQSSPEALIFILDLPPRKDPVFHPDYLREFYEDTKLDSRRQLLEKLPEVRPYFSSSLYLRSVLSPTAIIVRVEAGEAGRMEEIVRESVHPVAKEVVGIWLEKCALFGKRELGSEEELVLLEKRDGLIKSKTIEIDLGSNFPRLFGPEVSQRLLGAVRMYYNV